MSVFVLERSAHTQHSQSANVCYVWLRDGASRKWPPGTRGGEEERGDSNLFSHLEPGETKGGRRQGLEAKDRNLSDQEGVGRNGGCGGTAEGLRESKRASGNYRTVELCLVA